MKSSNVRTMLVLPIVAICFVVIVLLIGGCDQQAKDPPPPGRVTSGGIEAGLTNQVGSVER